MKHTILILLSLSCSFNLNAQFTPEDKFVNALIEIPAGSVEKWEMNKDSQQLELEQINGKPRIIQYLGYPANYGMVPKTLLREDLGGDGDPLDIVVLGPPLEKGTTVKTKVIGVLHLLDNNQVDDKLIAVSENSQFYHINNLEELEENYYGIKEILSIWFANYKGKGKMRAEGYGSEFVAWALIKSARKHYIEMNK